jgi:hypothetical protein
MGRTQTRHTHDNRPGLLFSDAPQSDTLLTCWRGPVSVPIIWSTEHDMTEKVEKTRFAWRKGQVGTKCARRIFSFSSYRTAVMAVCLFQTCARFAAPTAHGERPLRALRTFSQCDEDLCDIWELAEAMRPNFALLVESPSARHDPSGILNALPGPQHRQARTKVVIILIGLISSCNLILRKSGRPLCG